MKEKLLHTPEGVRDIYNSECIAKMHLEERITKCFHHHGFQSISTPTFEYYDIFKEERGTVAAKNVYRFFDREGNMLALRPDITPQIARCGAKYFSEEENPVRLCYSGNVYVNYQGYQGKLKESSQAGAELLNDASVEADAEMIDLMVNSLLQTGLTKLQIEVGEADFFKALVCEAGFDEEETEKLRYFIENKNLLGLEEMLAATEIAEDLKKIFVKFLENIGDATDISALKAMTKNERALRALSRLEDLSNLLEIYGISEYVSFDLGALSQYDYYTGIIFKAYTYGTGEPVAAGGRYDNLVGQFGKDEAAIGIAIYMDQLLTALTRQGIACGKEEEVTEIRYNRDNMKEMVQKASKLRAEGKAAVLVHENSAH